MTCRLLGREQPISVGGRAGQQPRALRLVAVGDKPLEKLAHHAVGERALDLAAAGDQDGHPGDGRPRATLAKDRRLADPGRALDYPEPPQPSEGVPRSRRRSRPAPPLARAVRAVLHAQWPFPDDTRKKYAVIPTGGPRRERVAAAAVSPREVQPREGGSTMSTKTRTLRAFALTPPRRLPPPRWSPQRRPPDDRSARFLHARSSVR